MKREKSLETILVISLGLIIFYLIFQSKLFIIVSIFIGFAGLLSQFLAEKIAWLWLKLAEALGFVVSKVLLTLVFFLILLPLAFLSRLFNKNSMLLKKKDDSYYVLRNHQYCSKDFDNMW